MPQDTLHKRVRYYTDNFTKTELAIKLAERDLKEKLEIPHLPDVPSNKSVLICRTWADCVNPNYDCINCPLRGGGSGMRAAVNRPYC